MFAFACNKILLHILLCLFACAHSRNPKCIQLEQYTFCDQNLLDVNNVSVSCTNGLVSYSICVNPSSKVDNGTIKAIADDALFNIKIFSHTFDLCEYISCPILPGDNTCVTGETEIPEEIALVQRGAFLHVVVKTGLGLQITCINAVLV